MKYLYIFNIYILCLFIIKLQKILFCGQLNLKIYYFTQHYKWYKNKSQNINIYNLIFIVQYFKMYRFYY